MLEFFKIVGGVSIVIILIFLFCVVVANYIKHWDKQKMSDEVVVKACNSKDILGIKATLAHWDKYISKPMRKHLEARIVDLELEKDEKK